MSLQLYNTLSREKAEFVPIDPSRVRLYMCGPTVYDYAHIGNARAFVAFDLLYRVVRQLYPNAVYVRNVTDIDDKIIDAMNTTGQSLQTLTQQMTKSFHEDMQQIFVLQPSIEPKATDHIPQMIEMIERLLSKGYAYQTGGHVLFHVPSWKGYGRLSRMRREELVAGARVEVAPYKRDSADFVLWKPAVSGSPGWNSPWGLGRPGWHIECSAMSATYLGSVFDIHGGGQDLIFPHHENEIAQSACCFTGGPHANYWFHNGFLTVDGTKMSKSLGNYYTVHQLLAQGFRGEAIRLALMTAHYRQPLDFTLSLLNRAELMLNRWYRALGHNFAEDVRTHNGCEAVTAALKDDVNTPVAIRELNLLAKKIFKERNASAIHQYRMELKSAGALMGLLQQEASEWFHEATSMVEISDTDVEALVSYRKQLRENNQFEEADEIRDLLASHGIIIEDTISETRWQRTPGGRAPKP